ncbi:hypothetical protein ACQZV8_21605 [Magnetococcales bacterium HHB-1]
MDNKLQKLPLSYRFGGDQIVHVIAQNLALTPTAQRYENRTNKPIHYPLVRVPDPSPEDLSPWEKKVHQVETYDPMVMRWIVRALKSDLPWHAQSPSDLKRFQNEQACLFAMGAIEWQAALKSSMSEVSRIDIEHCKLIKSEQNTHIYNISGTAKTRMYLLSIPSKKSVQGYLALRFDSFGRIVHTLFKQHQL